MTKNKSTVRNGILITLLSVILCLTAAVFCFTDGGKVFADEAAAGTQMEERPEKENSWVTEPKIDGWVYGKYASSAFTAAKALYGEVTYSVLYNNKAVNEALSAFTADEDGKPSRDAEAALGALHVVGEGYVLRAAVAAGVGTEETEEGLEFGYSELTRDIPFAVTKATNTWTELKLTYTLGSQCSWMYGGFGNSTHKLGGAKAEYGETLFTVVDEDGASVNDTLKGFRLEEDGSFSDETVKAVNALHIGKYAFRAEVKGTADYTGFEVYGGGNPQTAEFSIEKAENRWLVPPSVLGWIHGEFKNSYMQVRSACGIASVTVYRLEEIKNGEEITYKVSTALKFNLENGEIPHSAAVDLNLLGSGLYSMVAQVNGSGDYTGLNEGLTALNGERFEIFKATNSWASTPNVIRWTWGSFDKKVNLFTAAPNYPIIVSERRVSFGIYKDVSLGEAVAGLDNFTTVAGQVNDDIARLLAALPAGTYYLNARSEQSENYNGLSSVFGFTVAPARNYWEVTPQIAQWAWSGYNPEVNVISAVPTIGEPQNVVYGVYLDKNCNSPVAELGEFSFRRVVEDTVKYLLPEEVAAALGRLGAGVYYLKAEVAGTENYSRLSSVTTFTVQKVNNYWKTTPSVLSWRYGEYNKNTNTIHADPAFGGAAVIKIYHADGTPVLFTDNGELVSGFSLADGLVPDHVAGILATLGKGRYIVHASVAATSDYTGLNDYSDFADITAHGVELSIAGNANGWEIIPSVLGWTEGGFDAEKNSVAAKSVCGNESMRVTVLDSKSNVVFQGLFTQIDYTVLAGLDVGSYTVKFSVDGTDSYEALSGETTFAVTEDAVGLTGIIAAVVVFGVFDIAAAAFCIYLVVSRRRRIEEGFRNMIRKELHRR